MTTTSIKMMLATGLACAAATVLSAQTYDMSAKVPFGFQVEGRAYEAGKYRVLQRASDKQTVLENAATRDSVFIAGARQSVERPAKPTLVFHCYEGNSCFLSEIWSGKGTGAALRMSQAEKEIVNNKHAQVATLFIEMQRAD